MKTPGRQLQFQLPLPKTTPQSYKRRAALRQCAHLFVRQSALFFKPQIDSARADCNVDAAGGRGEYDANVILIFHGDG